MYRGSKIGGNNDSSLSTWSHVSNSFFKSYIKKCIYFYSFSSVLISSHFWIFLMKDRSRQKMSSFCYTICKETDNTKSKFFNLEPMTYCPCEFLQENPEYKCCQYDGQIRYIQHSETSPASHDMYSNSKQIIW